MTEILHIRVAKLNFTKSVDQIYRVVEFYSQKTFLLLKMTCIGTINLKEVMMSYNKQIPDAKMVASYRDGRLETEGYPIIIGRVEHNEDMVYMTNREGKIWTIPYTQAEEMYKSLQAVAVVLEPISSGVLKSELKLSVIRTIPDEDVQKFGLDLSNSIRRSMAINNTYNTKFISKQIQEFLAKYPADVRDLSNFYDCLFNCFCEYDCPVRLKEWENELEVVPFEWDTAMRPMISVTPAGCDMTRELFIKARKVIVPAFKAVLKLVVTDISTLMDLPYNKWAVSSHALILEHKAVMLAVEDEGEDIPSSIVVENWALRRLDISQIGSKATKRQTIPIKFIKCLNLNEVVVTKNPMITYAFETPVVEDTFVAKTVVGMKALMRKVKIIYQ